MGKKTTRDTKNMQTENTSKDLDKATESLVADTGSETIVSGLDTPAVETTTSDATAVVDGASTDSEVLSTDSAEGADVSSEGTAEASSSETKAEEPVKAVEPGFVTAIPTNPPAVEEEVAVKEDFEVTLLRDRLDTYQKVMSPKVRADENDRLLQQKALRTAVLAVLALRGAKFSKAMEVLLTFFHQNAGGCTGIRYVFREFERLGLDRATRTSYENLLHLLISAADPATRRLVSKQVDVPAALAGVRNNEEVYQLLSEFFG